MKYLILSIFIAIKSYSVWAETPEEKGKSIAIKSDKSNSGFTGEEATMEMVLINAHGDRVTRKMISKVKEVPEDGDMSIITFLWPADVKGTKMLTKSHKADDDDQWLYLPDLKLVKKISSRSKNGSFMGSEFSYEDLGSQEVEKYTYKYLRDEKHSGRDSWVSERYPNDKKSGYTKQVVWTDKEYLAPLKVEYFDRKNELLKTATFSDYKKINNFWRAKKIVMQNHQTKKSSELVWSDRKLGIKHSERLFHKNKLKN